MEESDGDLLANLNKFDSTLLLRYESFKTWPKQHVITKENLSSAGFSYRNTNDIVECKTCGIQINNWNEEDDPYVDHIKFSTGHYSIASYLFWLLAMYQPRFSS